MHALMVLLALLFFLAACVPDNLRASMLPLISILIGATWVRIAVGRQR